MKATGKSSQKTVPAHAGGGDLSLYRVSVVLDLQVPAHAGGVDLSQEQLDSLIDDMSPRPCGRGGFKPA